MERNLVFLKDIFSGAEYVIYKDVKVYCSIDWEGVKGVSIEYSLDGYDVISNVYEATENVEEKRINVLNEIFLEIDNQ